MTSKLAALAKILLLPRRSAPAFVRPLQRIFGTEPQENDDDDEEEQLEEQQQQHKGILLEALLMTRRGNLNSNYTKYHKGEQEQVGPITDPIAKHQLREVRNDYYRSAAINNNNNDNDSNSNFNSNFNFNTQHQDDQDTPPASSSSW